MRFRLLRDIAGVVVLAPVLVACVSPLLPVLPRLSLVVGTVFLVSYDGVRNEPLPPLRAAAGALPAAAAVGAAAALAGANPPSAGLCAALLLLLWYGARGVGTALVAGGRRVPLLLEYGVFVGVAAGALRWLLVSR